MDELLKKLSEQTGLDLSTATNGLGAVIAFLKEHLPANMFGQVTEAVPEANGLIDTFEANKVAPTGGGSMVAAVTGLVGKLIGQGGGAGAAELLKMLGAAGLSVGQITSFLPKVLELLQAHLPADLLEKIKELVLGGSSTPSAAE
jgi:Protein of unknown function VcgC/VcgE (DUF2780)